MDWISILIVLTFIVVLGVIFYPTYHVENRDKVAEQMTPDQIAEAQKLAREWMEKHGKG